MSATNETIGNVTIEIAGIEVTLPLKFQLGHVLSDSQAKILDAAYQRQYTNNMNANAKARGERLAKATTDAERAANVAMTADEIALAYSDYEPNVGSGPRATTMEKIRQDAAWRMWTSLVTAHNASVSAGGHPVIAKAGSKQVPSLKPIRDANGKVTVTVGDQRERMVARILTMPEYADAVQENVDAILAERGKEKETVAAGDTVALDDLFA